MRGFNILAGATLGLLLAGPAISAQSVRDGIAAWQKQDFTTAVAIWRPLAEKGDADAAFNLGQAYRLGRGVKVDLAQAQDWLEQAARKGHLDAQTTLGLLLFDSGNRSGAMRWLKSAAERGDPRAALVYGTALFNGDGVTADPVLAYAYVSRAAAQGLAPAKSTLADLDKLIPLADRKKGVAIALAQAGKAKPAPAAKAAAKPAPAKPAVVATGSWRIQLGAFSKRSSAESLFQRLSASAPVAGRRAVFVPAGAVTRLQVAPFASRAEAARACALLSARGQACFPVAGK
ncbi:MAG TPA: SPOR domain-containing protein [Sphingomicrobium sp.]|nr:SPOR domain-containing protein [Sphingomicrobium sp.]